MPQDLACQLHYQLQQEQRQRGQQQLPQLQAQHRAQKRSVKRQLFPEKLWDLVNKPDSGIHWSEDGLSIELERSQLEKFIGTKFRSHKFDSFIRQLHFYGFRKNGNSYHHDKFQRGHPEALLTMKRKYSNSPSPTQVVSALAEQQQQQQQLPPQVVVSKAASDITECAIDYSINNRSLSSGLQTTSISSINNNNINYNNNKSPGKSIHHRHSIILDFVHVTPVP